MEPQQKPSPESEQIPKQEQDRESPHEPEQPASSVIIVRSRQVITTAGTIEDESKAQEQQEETTRSPEQAQEESPSVENSNETTTIYQDQSQIGQERYVSNGDGTYTPQEYSEHHVAGQVVYETAPVEIGEGTVHQMIAAPHFDTEEPKVTYTNLQSVSSSFAGGTSYASNDGTTYIQQHQYQQFGPPYASRTVGDSPPSGSLIHRNDPNLASSRIYAPVSGQCAIKLCFYTRHVF